MRVYAESVVVVRGHLYLAIAKELGYQRIRAVVDKSSPHKHVQKFLQQPFVVQLEWEAVRQEDRNAPLVTYCWHTFFFEKPLNQEEQKIFEEQIVEFFRQIKLPAMTPTQL